MQDLAEGLWLARKPVAGAIFCCLQLIDAWSPALAIQLESEVKNVKMSRFSQKK